MTVGTAPRAPAARTPLPLPSTGLRAQLDGALAMRGDQVGFLERAVAGYGDIFKMRLFGIPMVMVNHPAYVQHVLVDNYLNYDKDVLLYRIVRPVFRTGIVTAVGGEAWHRQRRLMQPCFHRPNIADFANVMSDETDRMLGRWATLPRDAVHDITPDVGHLALRIVTRSLFGADVGPSTTRIEEGFTEINRIMADYFRFPIPPLSFPTKAHRRLRQRVRELDEFIAGLVEQRARHGTTNRDLLAVLSEAVDEQTGEGMTAEQLQHEVLNIMVGGYETTTYSLAWLLYLVARHPDVQQRLHDEVDAVLQGSTPDLDALTRLPYVRAVVDETLRVSPAAWQTMRHAVDDDEIGGYRIKGGSKVYVNLLTLHRNPELWPDPTRFDPDRFLPEQVARRPRNAYVPFGSGPRNCIGKFFALTELQVVLAMIAQRFHLTIPPGQPPVEMQAMVSLRPKGGVHLNVSAR